MRFRNCVLDYCEMNMQAPAFVMLDEILCKAFVLAPVDAVS